MNEEHLIFLISQPRSGSSMFQQLLVQHDEICSVPEPWMMLSLLTAILPNQDNAGFNRKYAQINFNSFLNKYVLRDVFLDHVKQTALALYSKANTKTYFLDKTPRYYHVIEDLRQIFPKAKFLFLVRNPIAVFSSILSYNFHGNIQAMLRAPDRQDDLLLAPKIILEQFHKYPKQSLFLRYEELVLKPELVGQKVIEFLNLKDRMPLKYEISDEFRNTMFVDKKSIHLHNKPVDSYLDAWKIKITTHEQKNALIDYLNKIDDQYLSTFNYERKVLIEDVNKIKVKAGVKSRIKISISWLKKYMIKDLKS